VFMAESVIGRRQMLRGAGLAAGGAAVATVAMAGPAGASESGGGGRIEGSWLVTRQDDPPSEEGPVQAVLSFASGGVIISHDILPAGPPFTGSWTARSRRRFRATILTGFPGEGGPGSPGVIVAVHLEGRLDGDTISGTYEGTVTDAAGGELDAFTGSFQGQRIEP